MAVEKKKFPLRRVSIVPARMVRLISGYVVVSVDHDLKWQYFQPRLETVIAINSIHRSNSY